jgi:hypothetical protein
MTAPNQAERGINDLFPDGRRPFVTLAGYCQTTYCVIMFGPLNGVRVALVSAAAFASLAAFFAGFTGAAALLLVGIAIHGAGWLYLYNHRDPDATDLNRNS